MSYRQCSPCTACCDGWLSSKKMKLQPGSGCVHCVDGGCGIYESRPVSPCRKFKCGWLQDSETLPEQMRPDISGAIVILGRYWKGIKIISAVPTGEEIPAKTLEWLRDYARRLSTPLIFNKFPLVDGKYSRAVKTGYGPPAFTDAVKNALGSDDIVKF